MAYDYKLLHVELEARIAWITVDAPPINVITGPVYGELSALSKELEADPNLSVVVLKNGSPFPNFPLSLVLEGNKHAEFRATDDQGRVAFKLSRSGRYMLRGTDLRRSTKPDLEWESDFTTLTLHAAPSRSKK